MTNPHLDPRVNDVRATPPPARALILDFGLTSLYSGQITGVEAHLDAVLPTGRVLVRDLNARLLLPVAAPTTRIDPGARMEFQVVMPLSASALASIEEFRQGSSLELTFRGEVEYSIAHSAPGGGHSYMGERRRWPLVVGLGAPFKHTIPQSDWIRMLSELQWNEIELLEVPRESANNPIFNRSYRLLKEASLALRQNQTDVSMFKCRKSFEAAVRDASGTEDLQTGTAQVLSGLPVRKREAVNELLLKLGMFTHLARHEHQEGLSFSRPEATLCLLMTAAAIDFLARL